MIKFKKMMNQYYSQQIEIDQPEFKTAKVKLYLLVTFFLIFFASYFLKDIDTSFFLFVLIFNLSNCFTATFSFFYKKPKNFFKNFSFIKVDAEMDILNYIYSNPSVTKEIFDTFISKNDNDNLILKQFVDSVENKNLRFLMLEKIYSLLFNDLSSCNNLSLFEKLFAEKNNQKQENIIFFTK